MANAAANRVSQVCPKWSEWIDVLFAADPIATGTEVPDKTAIDMGAAPGVSTNSDAQALTLEMPSNFDDSVHNIDSLLWLANNPQKTDITFVAEYETGAVMPAVSLDAPLAGTTAATLAGSPYQVPAAHKKTTVNEYDATENRIETIIIQLQQGLAAPAYKQDEAIHLAPQLMIESPRTEFGAQDRILREDAISMDLESGHLFAYPNDRIYFVENIDTSTEQWLLLPDVREDSIEYTAAKDFAIWKKGRPEVEFHRAISTVEATLTFTTGQMSPELLALSMQTTATRNSSRRDISVSIDGATCITGVREGTWVHEYQTIGGFVCRMIIGRGVLKLTGPGGGDFMEHTWEVTALARGNGRVLAEKRYSDTPRLVESIPLIFRTA